MIKIKAQASIEFVIAFVTIVVFLVCAVKLFEHFAKDLVARQGAYERTRDFTYSAWPTYTDGTTGPITGYTSYPSKDFYGSRRLDMFEGD